MIKIINAAAIEALTDISITVYGVANPEANNIANSYTVYHYNADGVALAVGSPTGVVI